LEDKFMAHLWVRDEAERWAVLPLEREAFSLSSTPPRPIARQLGEGDALCDALLIRADSPQADSWVLIASAGAGVSVNGVPLGAGIRVVSDRDQIRVGGEHEYYFSTETLARIEQFPGGEQPMYCPRCKQEIDAGASAVKCPACGVWHHQTDELNCWTYAQVCALCAQPTEMSTGFRWTPEEDD
jgi:hypothetical protein